MTQSVTGQWYTPKVSFDAFENSAASIFSFTLYVQSDVYARSRATKVFLYTSNPDKIGRCTLTLALKSLVQNKDKLILFRGVNPEGLAELYYLNICEC